MGLGYVGLPLSVLFARKFKVIGFDVDLPRIKSILAAESPTQDISSRTLKKCVEKTFFPTTDFEMLKEADFIIVCVPTPLSPWLDPDMRYIKDAAATASKVLRKGHFVILESTTFPGTTDDILVPILEKSGLKAGKDFGVAYSPERIDPGSRTHTMEDTPKVVGGISRECAEIAAKLYGSVIDAKVIVVKDCRTAEAVKIVENIYREVNIALVNELALIFERMDIDTWEVIRAAATKPFGYQPFYPGPGVGGHCIPLDPLYMSYKAKKFGFIPRFIELSREINEYMKMHVVNFAERGLKKVGRRLFGSRIAVIGLAYKKDISDSRESPSEKIIEELMNLGAEVKLFDPYVKRIRTKEGIFVSEENIENAVRDVDCTIFVTDHTMFTNLDFSKLGKLMRSKVIVDCRNIVPDEEAKRFVYLGIGKRNV